MTAEDALRRALRECVAMHADDLDLVEALMRELAWSLLVVKGLAYDVELARAFRENRGGQQAGTPCLVSLPPSVIAYFERELRSVLNGARIDVPLEDLVRDALEQK